MSGGGGGGKDYFRISILLVALTMAATTLLAQAQLTQNFYSSSCPKAEQMIKEYVNKHIPNAPSLASPLLRMHFHDCFVRGCDGSVLLNATSNNTQPEKTATPNLTLRGFDFIERVKTLIEKGGPSWSVPTGRRDGKISLASEALANIPPPTSNFTSLVSFFKNKTLDLKDLVLLSGAHTIGVAHCSAFSNRLYNFTTTVKQDPSLDSEYAEILKKRKCLSLSDNTTLVEMDPGSFRTFDLSYFKLLLKRRGLFQSDAALVTNATTKAFVEELVNGSVDEFFKEFGKSMVKMGGVGVKTGSDGEIRKQCALVNS